MIDMKTKRAQGLPFHNICFANYCCAVHIFQTNYGGQSVEQLLFQTGKTFHRKIFLAFFWPLDYKRK